MGHVVNINKKNHERFICRPFVTKVSQLKIYDFSGETFKGFELLLIPCECNEDTAALQRRVLQTAS